MSLSRNPLVSIVVTTYNGEKYLGEQLASIVNQTYKNLEIIVCDDASSDNTAGVIKQFAAIDNRIIPILHHQNIGLHANLESGFSKAAGEYIAISDQDDIWKLEKIELLLNHIGDNLAIFSDSVLIDDAGNSRGLTLMQSLKIKDWNNCYKPLNLVIDNVVSGHALLLKVRLLRALLPLKQEVLYDLHIALAASACDSLVFFPEPLVLHRIHDKNLTNYKLLNKEKNAKAAIATRNERMKRLAERFEILLGIRDACRDLPGFEKNRLFFNDLEIAVKEAKRSGSIFFNVPLYILLRRLGRSHPEYKLFKPRRCFSLAKGSKWYRLFNRSQTSPPDKTPDPVQAKPQGYYSHPRPRMAVYLPENAKTCLDIGCGAGRFGELLKMSAPHIEIWGIEIVPSIAAQAKAKLDHVLVGDALSLINELPDNYFDCIFFNDSLEHMVDPYAMLRAIKPKLKQPEGVIIASIPNIRHFSCLYNLIVKKDWRYAESGVMDFTHLRFFTQNSIRRMFMEANYNVKLLEGVSGSRKLRAKIWGWLSFGWMNDIRFKQFAVVAGIK